MTNCSYTVPSLYSLIYVYEIPGSVDHACFSISEIL